MSHSHLLVNKIRKKGERQRGEKKEGAFLIEANLFQKDHSRVLFLYHRLGMGHMVTPGCNGGCPGLYLPNKFTQLLSLL